MKKFTALLIASLVTMCSVAHAGMRFEDVNKKIIGFGATIGCGTGVSCVLKGEKVTMTVAGVTPTGSGLTNFPTWPANATTTSGTSTTPSATTVYLSQVFIPYSVTLTGINVDNAATCGTNKYIVALFSAAGVPLANSALAGVLCSGTSAYQAIPFTSTYAAVGPGVYWIGIYMNGTTDRFYTIPAGGAQSGLSGTVTAQTFGTVATVVPPTTFTAGAGPVAFTY